MTFPDDIAADLPAPRDDDVTYNHVGQCEIETDYQAPGGAVNMVATSMTNRCSNGAGRIPGIGPLAMYDFACRVGAGMRPKLQSTKIYLHSGTRIGARALGRGRQAIDAHELPSELRRLSPRHAEDVSL
jgi:hypothetical protein